MGYEPMEVHIRGVVPTMMKNGQTTNPLNKWAKAIKEITTKRKKSDEDHSEISRIEFMGALYVGDDGAPCWPGENVEAMLISAAKKNKMGPTAKTSIIVDGSPSLIYDGPKSADQLWKDERFVSLMRVKVGQAAVMRCRPIFRDWELKFTILYLPELVNASEVKEWVSIAATQIGLSDFRPRYGRFNVVSIKNGEAGKT